MSQDTGLFVVRMLDVPLVLRERSRQHGAELLREMTLITIGHADRTTSGEVPARLLELAHELDTFYGPYIASSVEDMDAALDRGQEVCDEVVFHLPPQSAAFVRRIADMLSEVESYCRADGYLLTLAPAPDIAAYRDWSITEVLRQRSGEQPTPWPVYAAAHLLD